MSNFSELLNRLLLEHSVSRARLARATGVSVTAVGHWCTGNGKPSNESVAKIADFLGADRGELLSALTEPLPERKGLAEASFEPFGEVGKQEETLSLSPSEKALIRVWRLLNTDEKRIIMRAAGVDFQLLSRLFGPEKR